MKLRFLLILILIFIFTSCTNEVSVKISPENISSIVPLDQAPKITLSELAVTLEEDADEPYKLYLSLFDKDAGDRLSCGDVTINSVSFKNTLSLDSVIASIKVVPNTLSLKKDSAAAVGESADCIVEISPKHNRNGIENIIFSIDNGLPASETLALTITEEDDPLKMTLTPSTSPTFALTEDQTKEETLVVKIEDPDSITSCSNIKMDSSKLVTITPLNPSETNSSSNSLDPDNLNPLYCNFSIEVIRNKFGDEKLSVKYENSTTKQFLDTADLTLSIKSQSDPIEIKAVPDNFTIPEDEMAQDKVPVLITVTLTDYDSSTPVPCSKLSITGHETHFRPLNSQTLNAVSPCTLSFMPDTDKNGTGSIQLSVINVNDGMLSEKNITYQITSVDDPPVINITSPTLSFKKNGHKQDITLTLSDKDSPKINCGMLRAAAAPQDTDLVTVKVLDEEVVVDEVVNCKVAVTPNTDKIGSGEIELLVNNWENEKKTLSFTISEDQAPTIQILTNSPLSINEDTTDAVEVEVKVDDVDSDLSCSNSYLSIDDITNTKLELISIKGTKESCSLSIKPKKNEYGVQKLTFTVTTKIRGSRDSTTRSASSELTVNIINQDDPPEIKGLPSEFLTFEEEQIINSPIPFQVSDIDSSVSCANVSVSSKSSSLVTTSIESSSLVTTSITGEYTQNCNLKLVLNENAFGENQSIILIVNNGASSTKTLKFSITNKIDPPVITLNSTPPFNPPFNEDDTNAKDLLFTVEDVEGSVDCTRVQISEIFTAQNTKPKVTSGNSTEQSKIDNKDNKKVCKVSITPNKDEYGDVKLSLSYTNNTNNTKGTKEVSFNITPIDDAPKIVNISPKTLSFQEDGDKQTVSFEVNDIDSPDVNCSQVTVATTPILINGKTLPLVSLDLNSQDPKNCSLVVTPIKDRSGQSTIRLTVETNQKIGTANLSFNISNIDKAPIAEAVAKVILQEEETKNIPLTYSDSDGDKASRCDLSKLDPVALSGSCSCDPNTGACSATITGVKDYYGTTNFDYTVSANNKNSTPINVTVEVQNINDQPIIMSIADQSIEFGKNLELTIDVSDLDDVSGKPSSLNCLDKLIVTSSNQAILLNSKITKSGSPPSCRLTLTPEQNTAGTSQISVTISDGFLSNSTTFTLTVRPIAPSISFSPTSVEGVVGKTLEISPNILSNGALHTCSTTTTGLPAGMRLEGCLITGTPTTVGSKDYTITASNSAGPKSATVRITITDTKPEAMNISPTIKEDTETVIRLSYSDPDGHIASSCKVTSPVNLTTGACSCRTVSATESLCEVSVKGSPLDYSGPASFSYTVTTESLESNVAIASVTITSDNDAPTITIDDKNLNPQTKENETRSVPFTISDVDSTLFCDSRSLTATFTNTNPSAISAHQFSLVSTTGISQVCQITFTPTTPIRANASTGVTIRVSDNNGTDSKSATATMNLTINDVNFPPIFGSFPGTVKTTFEKSISAPFEISDQDSDLNCTSSVTASSSNTSLISSSGIVLTNVRKNGSLVGCSIALTPQKNQVGQSTITLRLSDGVNPVVMTFNFVVDPVPPEISFNPISIRGFVGNFLFIVPIIPPNGATTTCTLSGTLPSGLNFDPTTCKITGTPTQTQVRTPYRMTASNTINSVVYSAFADFQIEVVNRIKITGGTNNQLVLFSGDDFYTHTISFYDEENPNSVPTCRIEYPEVDNGGGNDYYDDLSVESSLFIVYDQNCHCNLSSRTCTYRLKTTPENEWQVRVNGQVDGGYMKNRPKLDFPVAVSVILTSITGSTDSYQQPIWIYRRNFQPQYFNIRLEKNILLKNITVIGERVSKDDSSVQRIDIYNLSSSSGKCTPGNLSTNYFNGEIPYIHKDRDPHFFKEDLIPLEDLQSFTHMQLHLDYYVYTGQSGIMYGLNPNPTLFRACSTVVLIPK